MDETNDTDPVGLAHVYHRFRKRMSGLDHAHSSVSPTSTTYSLCDSRKVSYRVCVSFLIVNKAILLLS